MNRMGSGLIALTIACAPQLTRAAEPLPRIFFTAAERTAIVEQRRNAATASASASASASTTAPTPAPAPAPDPASTPAPAPAKLRLDGISIAQGGETFAWFSGHRYTNGSLLGSARLLITRDGVRLTDRDGRTRTIRVGESLGRVP